MQDSRGFLTYMRYETMMSRNDLEWSRLGWSTFRHVAVRFVDPNVPQAEIVLRRAAQIFVNQTGERLQCRKPTNQTTCCLSGKAATQTTEPLLAGFLNVLNSFG